MLADTSKSTHATYTPTVDLVSIPYDLAVEKIEILSRSEGNWWRWKCTVDDVLVLSGLDGYICGKVACPDDTTDPRGARNWRSNNRAVLALLANRCSYEDRNIIQEKEIAKEAWDALVARHENLGPGRQALLIRESLNIRYNDSEPYSKTTARIAGLASQIFAAGPPTEDAFLSALMLYAMGRALGHLQGEIATLMDASTVENPYTSSDIYNRLRLAEQLKQLAAKDKSVTSSSTTLGTSSMTRGRRGRRRPDQTGIPSRCANCKGKTHVLAKCYAKGGPMEGRRDEVIALNRAERQEKAGATFIRGKDPNGRPFVLDTTTGESYYPISQPLPRLK